MSANQYEFVTVWEIPASRDEVFRVIERTTDYPRWWPEVWLEVEEIDPGDSNKIGSRYRLFTKGRLPYRLRWESRTLEKTAPERIRIEATGDFVGSGLWTLSANGESTTVRYDWVLRADKPLLRRLSWLLKPLFRWNHHWAMARGQAALIREIERVRRLNSLESNGPVR